jgi:hypothetical protein
MRASIARLGLRADDHGVTAATNLRITLELEPGADPIRGSLEHTDGSRRTFWGWLELMEELRGVTAEPEAQTRQPPTPTTTKEEP